MTDTRTDTSASSVPASESCSTTDTRLTLLGIAVVTLAITMRVLYRGPYYPGWDLLWSAQGAFLLATKSWGEIVQWLRLHHYGGTLYPSVLLPGLLATWFPWEGWTMVVNLGYTVASLAALALAFRVAHFWVLLLAWACSGALLSWAVAGHPVVTCFWPHALALAIVCRLCRWPLLSGLLLLGTMVIAWHCYEQARTVFLVPLLAAIVERDLSWRTRLVWLGVGAWSAWDMVAHQTANQARFVHWPALTDLMATVVGIAKQLPRLDTPMVYVLGIVGLIGIRRHAALVRLLLLAQLGLVGVIGLQDPVAIWPRRFLMVPFFCIALVVAAWQDRPRWRRAILALFLAGIGWQLWDTVRFVRQPFNYVQGYGYTLPYVWSTVDYMVPYDLIDLYGEMARQVEGGRDLVLVYNLEAHDENATNPTGILHRLYLHFGDAVWRQRIHVYGTTQCSHDCCVPIRPMDAVGELAKLDPAKTVGYAITADMDAPNFRVEAAAVMDVLNANFHVDAQGFHTGHGAYVQRLMLSRKS